MAAQMHPPVVIFVMLVLLALVAALLNGHDLARGGPRSWLHVLAFAIILSGTVYVILDIEFPRMGFIRIDAVDQVLIDLRASMK